MRCDEAVRVRLRVTAGGVGDVPVNLKRAHRVAVPPQRGCHIHPNGLRPADFLRTQAFLFEAQRPLAVL
jgi:hypothetical protein